LGIGPLPTESQLRACFKKIETAQHHRKREGGGLGGKTRAKGDARGELIQVETMKNQKIQRTELWGHGGWGPNKKKKKGNRGERQPKLLTESMPGCGKLLPKQPGPPFKNFKNKNYEVAGREKSTVKSRGRGKNQGETSHRIQQEKPLC